MSVTDRRNLPVGIFDSGLGGLTVLKELRRYLPHEQFVYLGDTARTPYGSKSRETIQRYSLECASFLERQGIKLLVVACNTSSSLALDVLIDKLDCPVVGTIEPAVREALAGPAISRVGVIGTKATIQSGAYTELLHARSPGLSISSIACPLFVPLVEEGICSGPIVESVVQMYLSPFRAQPVDSLILGCTHYPLLSAEISAYLGSGTTIIQCSSAIAGSVRKILDDVNLAAEIQRFSHPEERYYVTDDVGRFNELASLFLDGRKVEAVKIESL